MRFLNFIVDGAREMFRGSVVYWGWLAMLAMLTIFGTVYYVIQLRSGLIVTGMSDQVSWGFYIANFAFLVGIAAAAVLLVIPAYLFARQDMRGVVIIGEAMAVATVVIAMLFVIVDLGRPDRMLHLLPLIGRFNFPMSMLAWDVVVLFGYLALNLAIPCYVLFMHYQNREPVWRYHLPVLVVTMFWAISIHTVTAFLFSANPARPLWHTAILGPRFIASAFASGPAIFILTLAVIRRSVQFPVREGVVDTLALIMAIAMQVNLFLVGAELFTDFYNEGTSGESLRYLYLGMQGAQGLKAWIWTALIMDTGAVVILMINPLRKAPAALNIACVLTLSGVWIEKGIGLIVPGFIPTTLGEVFEYTPTWLEINVSIGIWAFGALLFTLLAKPAVAIESGRLRLEQRRSISSS